jgi:imidazolonepropionase-like amidohydrolase
MSIILEPTSIISPLKVIENATLIIDEDGRIEYCGSREDAPRVIGNRLNLKGKIVSPGLIFMSTVVMGLPLELVISPMKWRNTPNGSSAAV